LFDRFKNEWVIALEKRTFNIAPEQASYIDRLVAAGTYPSGSEVIRAGLAALQERDATVEQWLREQVAPVYDAMEADPARAVSADDVVAAIHSRHAKRLKTRKRGT
jgi:antitoxin ParD1/3/4